MFTEYLGPMLHALLIYHHCEGTGPIIRHYLLRSLGVSSDRPIKPFGTKCPVAMSRPSLRDAALLFCTVRAPMLIHRRSAPRSTTLLDIQCRKVRKKPLKCPKRALQRQTRTQTVASGACRHLLIEADGHARPTAALAAQPSQTAPTIWTSPAGAQAPRAN